jgi:hypothetical protein
MLLGEEPHTSKNALASSAKHRLDERESIAPPDRAAGRMNTWV